MRPFTVYVPGAVRRTVDVVVSLLNLVLLAPVLVLVAIAIVMTDGRPVLFKQKRVGEGGRTFTMYKLRTMRHDPTGPSVTTRGDARITKIGRVLRATSLDEIPQLFNVLRGDMTLVGPRPETPALAVRYPAEARPVLQARPGLTGPAQVQLRDVAVIPEGVADLEDYYLSVIVPARARIDLEYLEDPSIVRTTRVLFQTVFRVVVPERRIKPVPAPAVASQSDRSVH